MTRLVLWKAGSSAGDGGRSRSRLWWCLPFVVGGVVVIGLIVASGGPAEAKLCNDGHGGSVEVRARRFVCRAISG